MTYSQSGPWSSTRCRLVSSVPNHCAFLHDTLRENNLDYRAGYLLETCVYGGNGKESSRNHHFKLKEGFAKLRGGLLFLLHIFKTDEHSWPDCQAWLTARAMNFKGRVITPQGWSKLQSPSHLPFCFQEANLRTTLWGKGRAAPYHSTRWEPTPRADSFTLWPNKESHVGTDAQKPTHSQ